MKKCLLLIPVLIFMLAVKGFSQTVYVGKTGQFYHTNKCQNYAKSFEAVPLWKAKGPYGKRPCTKCKPPTKEGKAVKKKPAAKKPAPAKK